MAECEHSEHSERVTRARDRLETLFAAEGTTYPQMRAAIAELIVATRISCLADMWTAIGIGELRVTIPVVPDGG